MEIVTASIFFSLSNISLKSSYFLAFGYFLTVSSALPFKSTSHRATTFSLPFDSEFEISADQIQKELSSLVIPFSIPPMLARWDRALKEFYLEENIEQLSFLDTDSSEESEEEE